jgi:hypothetical protein
MKHLFLQVFSKAKYFCDEPALLPMQREDIARIAMGLMVLLLPYAGSFTVLPLAAVFLWDRNSRMLSASLAMLLILRPALSVTHINLPLYVIAISFVVYFCPTRLEVDTCRKHNLSDVTVSLLPHRFNNCLWKPSSERILS